MPLYEYKCFECNNQFDKIFKIGYASEVALCPSCDGYSFRFFSPVSFKVGIISPYYDVGLGTVVKGNTDRKCIMKEKGLEEAGGIPVSEFNKRKVNVHEEKRKKEERKKEAIEYMNYLEDQGVPLK